MKKLLALFVLAAAFVPAFAATQTAVSFSSAAGLYNRGDYASAVIAYQTLLRDSKNKDPYAFYNLANSYFKAGQTDQAIINYYRAFRLLPRDGDIKHNLSFALNATGQRLLPEGVPQAAFDAFYFFSLSELGGTALICLWLFAIAFAVYTAGFKKKFLKKLFICLGILFIIFGIWYGARCSQDSSSLAVVTVPRAEVRSGPGDNFPVSLSVPRAHLVTVNDTKDNWTEIVLPAEKSEGWVLNTSIEEI